MDETERDPGPRNPSAEEAVPRRRRRWGRGLLITLLLIVIVVGGVGAALVMSGRGQRIVLDAVLSRARDQLAGELVVDAIRSRSLVTGGTLVGVHLSGSDGRPFLVADSIRFRYSVLSLLAHVPRIASVVVWGPTVTISRLPGEASANVTRLLAPPKTPADTVPSSLRVTLASLRVVGAAVHVLTPVEGPLSAGIPTVDLPDGNGRLRVVGLDSLSLELRDLAFEPGAPEMLSGTLASMGMDVSILEQPFRLSDATGKLTAGRAGIRLEEGEFRLPSSTLTGTLALGPQASDAGAWGLDLEVRTRGQASLADFRWLDSRIPRGTFSGGVRVTVASATNVELQKVRLDLEASRLDLDGRVALEDEGLQLRALSVDASPLVLRRLEPWVGHLPVEGWLSGHATLSGRLDALETRGRVTFVPTGHTGRPTTADFAGSVYAVASNPGLGHFVATLDPMNFDLLDALFPRLDVTGDGRARVEATGRLADGIRFSADVTHLGDSIPDSRAVMHGTVRRSAREAWNVDVQSDFSPLALALLGSTAPSLDLQGTAAGSMHAVGPLTALHVTGDLGVAEGRLTFDGTLNATRPTDGYRLQATLDGVRASQVVGVLPARSLLSGQVVLDGRGITLDSVEARGSVTAFASRIGGLHVDSVTAVVSAARGQLTVDSLDASLGGMKVSGSGELGLVRGHVGEARLAFHTDSLLGLRSVLLGDSVVTRDGLSSLELDLLRMEGVNPDTLPTNAEVAMSGALDGRVTLRGSLPALDLEGSATLISGVFGADSLGTAVVRFNAQRALSTDREVHVDVDAENVSAFGRSFDRIRAVTDFKGNAGRASADVTRSSAEEYAASGDFTLHKGSGDIVVDSLMLRLDSITWKNDRTVRASWDSAGITVRDLDIVRPDDALMHVTAEGTLAWRGTSDFQVDARGLRLDRVARVIQREDLGVKGQLDLGLRLTGPANAPFIDASFRVDEPRFADVALSSVSGELHYRDDVAQIRLDADDHGRNALNVEGSVPVNLALQSSGSRITSSPMDVRVRADSLDAAVALSYVKTLQDVEGTVTGNFHIGGTVDEPEPSGVVRLSGGAWSVESLGVRHTGVQGSLTLKSDRTVEVALTGRTREGSATVNGQVTLSPARDPGLDLKIAVHDFEAVNRRDVNGAISGEVHLTGSYRLPFLKGDLTVDHGNLFLEEFARSAEVVDLTDPRIFDVVDTTALENRPLLAGIRNPFMDNLRVEVNLSVPRDTWLRSEDMNVEMGGKLLVRYDRPKRDVVMVGELQALRGSYSVLGRRFEVREGTVEFIGTPGINPTLAIQAVARVRRVEADPLEVTATVSGTLTQPKVNLTSDEQGVAESDLVSYLIFGRPSYALATGQEKFAQGAAGSVLGAAASAGVTYLSGTLATRLGSALSRQVGIDYLSITQAGDFGVATGSLAGSALDNTQVEVGQYWGDNVFFVLVFRPRPQPQQSVFAGARVEVALNDSYSFQSFWEDRFLRSGVTGFGDLAGQASRVVGVFIFRDWGY